MKVHARHAGDSTACGISFRAYPSLPIAPIRALATCKRCRNAIGLDRRANIGEKINREKHLTVRNVSC